MSRIRTIKPEFNKHEKLFDAEQESGLPLRVAYPGLWMQADRQGRFKWEIRKLKSEILPYDDLDFSRVLDALATRGFIVKYACGTDVYGWIPSFTKHQIVNNRERESELPSPYGEDVEILVDSSDNIEKHEEECGFATRERRVNDACITENQSRKDFLKWKGTGREQEGKGKEGNNTVCTETKKISSSVPHQGEPLYEFSVDGVEKIFFVFAGDIERWQRDFKSLDIHAELCAMRAWLEANPEKRKTKRGMPKFIVGWLSRSQNSGKGQKSGGNHAKQRSGFETEVEKFNRLLDEAEAAEK